MSNMEMGIGLSFIRGKAESVVKNTGMRMPLNRVATNGEYIVEKVSGKDDTKKHLCDLGFVAGEVVKVSGARAGNMIVTVKGVKIAIGEDLAKRITVRG